MATTKCLCLSHSHSYFGPLFMNQSFPPIGTIELYQRIVMDFLYSLSTVSIRAKNVPQIPTQTHHKQLPGSFSDLILVSHLLHNFTLSSFQPVPFIYIPYGCLLIVTVLFYFSRQEGSTICLLGSGTTSLSLQSSDCPQSGQPKTPHQRLDKDLSTRRSDSDTEIYERSELTQNHLRISVWRPSITLLDLAKSLVVNLFRLEKIRRKCNSLSG